MFLMLVLGYRIDRLKHRDKAESINEDDIDSALTLLRAQQKQKAIE